MPDLDLRQAFDAHLPAARALSPDEILPFRLDVDLAINNVATGLQVVHAHAAEIPVVLPKEDLAALLSLDELARALKHAALQAELEVPEQSLVSAKLKEANELRTSLLSVAKGLAQNGLIPQAEVDVIAAGRGVRDRVEDCASLAVLFQKYENDIAGKHAITPARIQACAEVGAWLITHLRPANAPATGPAAPSTIVDDRNRLATLLIRRHARLQAVAHYFHDDDWEDRAPALGSRSVKRRPKQESPADPAPATP